MKTYPPAKSETLTGFLVDPAKKTITKVEVPSRGSTARIYELIEADCFDGATFRGYRDGSYDTAWVDDTGRLRGIYNAWTIEGYAHVLAGKGLILGVDRWGETIAPKVTEEQLREAIEFIGPVEEVF